MQTRHSAHRSLPTLLSVSVMRQAIVASEFEVAADFREIFSSGSEQLSVKFEESGKQEVRSLPNVKSTQRRRQQRRKPAGLIEGVLGLASLISETEGEATGTAELDLTYDPVFSEPEHKPKRKPVKSTKDAVRKKPKPAASSVQQSASPSSLQSVYQQIPMLFREMGCLSYCRLGGPLAYLPTGLPLQGSNLMSASFDMYLKSMIGQNNNSLPCSQSPTNTMEKGAQKLVQNGKLRKSTIHVAIAFFIKNDLQDKKTAID